MAYTELIGRRPTKSVDKVVYQTIGIAEGYSDTGIPKQGDSLTSPEFYSAIPAICVQVTPDEKQIPGRLLIFSAWVQHIPRGTTY
jgi:hypothetical protein